MNSKQEVFASQDITAQLIYFSAYRTKIGQKTHMIRNNKICEQNISNNGNCASYIYPTAVLSMYCTHL